MSSLSALAIYSFFGYADEALKQTSFKAEASHGLGFDADASSLLRSVAAVASGSASSFLYKTLDHVGLPETCDERCQELHVQVVPWSFIDVGHVASLICSLRVAARLRTRSSIMRPIYSPCVDLAIVYVGHGARLGPQLYCPPAAFDGVQRWSLVLMGEYWMAC